VKNQANSLSLVSSVQVNSTSHWVRSLFLVGSVLVAAGCQSRPTHQDQVSEEVAPKVRTIDVLRDTLKPPVEVTKKIEVIDGESDPTLAAEPPKKMNQFMLTLDDKNTNISFNCELGHANWVSWTVAVEDFGPAKRTKRFHEDSKLPKENCLVPKPDSLSGSGFDRGHMTPSADRTRDAEFNKTVFSMANIVPQAPQVNQKGWNDLEMLTRELVKQGSDAVVLSGTFGTLGKIPTSGINIPEYTWKVVMLAPTGALKLSESTTKVYAVLYKNALELAPVPLNDALVSVDELEAKIGMDVLSGLQDDLEARLEKKKEPLPAKAPVMAADQE
jgi:endonuclease G